MARIFISGSSAGLGLMAAGKLISQGHKVVLHARNAARADDARRDRNTIPLTIPRSQHWLETYALITPL